jgi:hypothetical protein
MVSLTLSISQDLKDKMDQFPEMNWSHIARKAINDKIEKMELMERLHEFTKDSELTEEDALRLGKEIDKSVAKRFEYLVNSREAVKVNETNSGRKYNNVRANKKK